MSCATLEHVNYSTPDMQTPGHTTAPSLAKQLREKEIETYQNQLLKDQNQTAKAIVDKFIMRMN